MRAAPVEESTAPDAIVERVSRGARLLTLRGIGMRIVSVASGLALVALVRPADLGLLAVVRGLATLTGNATDLGFAWALLRRERPPAATEYRALAGVQLAMVVVVLAVVALEPSVLRAGAIAPEYRLPMLAVLATTLAIPFGTSAKIRIERAMDYRRIAILDVTNVLFLNGILLGFALAGRFPIGVFIATGFTILYGNGLLWFWSPGPGPSFRLAGWKKLAGDLAGFSVAHVCYVLYSSATPILIANLFGLATAGGWALATRFGNLLQASFEGFRRAAIPAAALLVRSHEALRRVAEDSLRGTSRLAIPAVAALVIGLPVVGMFWPQWREAVGLSQLYLIGFGVNGMIAASLVPVAVAVSGSRVALGEQIAPMATGWLGFLVLHLLGRTDIGWAVLPMFAASVVTLYRLTVPAIRPRWNGALIRSLGALGAATAVTVTGMIAGWSPIATAAAAGLLFAWLWLPTLQPVRSEPFGAAERSA